MDIAVYCGYILLHINQNRNSIHMSVGLDIQCVQRIMHAQRHQYRFRQYWFLYHFIHIMRTQQHVIPLL